MVLAVTSSIRPLVMKGKMQAARRLPFEHLLLDENVDGCLQPVGDFLIV
jgi:hypothetical protein